MPYALSGGCRIHYEVDGAGPPLLLYAGFTCTLRDWFDLGYVETLRHDYRLIMLDPLGQGESDKPHTTESYAPDRRVLDALAVLDALGVYRTQFWGYSMGGRIGFDLAVKHPERFETLILGGTRPAQAVPNLAWAELFRQGMPGWVESVEHVMSPFPPSIHDRLLTADGEALAAATLVERSGMEDRLGGIEIPTLIYCGDQDPAHEGARQAAEAMPNATFASLGGLNHIDGWVDSELVLRHARPFLREPTHQIKTV
jgi:pimeloyl-ACP methyl ester carboxylesterase